MFSASTSNRFDASSVTNNGGAFASAQSQCVHMCAVAGRESADQSSRVPGCAVVEQTLTAFIAVVMNAISACCLQKTTAPCKCDL